MDTKSLTDGVSAMFTNVLGSVPRFLGALVLLILAGIIANFVRGLIMKLLQKIKLSSHLDDNASASLKRALAEIGFALVWLLFLPGIFERLGVVGILAPIQLMVGSIFGFLPNLLGAGIIFYVGITIAKILKQIVVSLLQTAGADHLAERFGVGNVLGNQKLSNLCGTVVYALVLLPIIVVALQALKMDSITAPATLMIADILTSIPKFFGAVITVGLAYVIGRIVSGVVTSLLAGIGFDELPAKMGLTINNQEGARKPSEIAGTLVLISILVIAVTQAAQLLGFGMLADLTKTLTLTGGQVLSGMVVLALGMYVANIVANMVRTSGVASAHKLAVVARVVILGFVGAMALKQMGIAGDIVNTAFSLILGAFAVAAALAFGLGGRETAGRLLNEYVETMKNEAK